MFGFFFKPWLNKKQEERTERPKLLSLLCGKIQTEYLDLPFYKKKIFLIGPKEIERANQYIKGLQTFSPIEWILFNKVLADIKTPFGEGELGNSKNLRVLLAEGLCEYLGIGKREIEIKTYDGLSIFPAANVAISYDLIKINAAIALIDKKCKDGLELNEIKPS
jgi:hypothetical protein